MKQTNIIPEVFSKLDTALLSAQMNASKDVAGDARRWLLENKSELSQGAYRMLVDLGVKKKGFNLTLKKWFKQYQKRREFILDNTDSSDKEWCLAMGKEWLLSGGVFFDKEGDDIALSADEMKGAFRKGMLTLLNESTDSYTNVIEVAVGSPQKFNAVLSLMDRCALPIGQIKRVKERNVTYLVLTSPNESLFNAMIAKTELPAYAKLVTNVA